MFNKDTYNKLTDYCAYQERCAADVKDKLHKLKADKNDYSEYISRLKQEKYLDEERYTLFFVNGHIRKKWGRNKIKSALLQKGIDLPLIKKCLDAMNDETYSEQLKIIAAKKWNTIKAATPRERKNKLLRFLLSKGFEMNKVLKVMKDFN